MRSPPPRVSILMHMLSTGTHTRVHTHTDFPSLSSALVSAVHVFIKGHTRGRVSFWGEFPAPRGQGEGLGEPARGLAGPEVDASVCYCCWRLGSRPAPPHARAGLQTQAVSDGPTLAQEP